MLRLFSLLLLLACSSPLWAWNRPTHRLIAEMAWQRLPQPVREQISHYLLLHPDSDRWIRNAQSLPPNHASFLAASSWPDDIRHDPRYYDEHREAPTPVIPGLADQARHRHWHYMDRQIAGSPREGHGVLDTQLIRLIDTFATAPVIDQVYALPWIIHLVGEIHQPLHVGSHHDKGGTLRTIVDPLHPRSPPLNLHQWWDDLLVPHRLPDAALEQQARRLLAHYPPPRQQGGVVLWAQESFDLAAQDGYPASDAISPAFRARSTHLARQRTVAAAYRLSILLQRLIDKVSRGTSSE